jgi:hypothetical protein
MHGSAGHNRQAAGLSPSCCSGAGHDGGFSLVVWRGLCLCEGLDEGMKSQKSDLFPDAD